MNKDLKAAIIGYWRSGATIEEIIGITGLLYREVVAVIEEYRNHPFSKN